MKFFIYYMLLIYKKILSPFLKLYFAGGCRYRPTCSEYSNEAIKRFGIIKGGLISIKRILKCHPASRHSIYGPVPLKFEP